LLDRLEDRFQQLVRTFLKEISPEADEAALDLRFVVQFHWCEVDLLRPCPVGESESDHGPAPFVACSAPLNRSTLRRAAQLGLQEPRRSGDRGGQPGVILELFNA